MPVIMQHKHISQPKNRLIKAAKSIAPPTGKAITLETPSSPHLRPMQSQVSAKFGINILGSRLLSPNMIVLSLKQARTNMAYTAGVFPAGSIASKAPCSINRRTAEEITYRGIYQPCNARC
ncbi:uncharacterized protein HMPREF1120_02081 [Exophiala dermatitidis NIH/UT8656]|uniref:Uncharacterized protein n=1 Tax=Exophiala dermatitidis (strain ATCC 34100 / CBS 525.76 / NIH/UT8656) TaxID=858893 RepID=H6BR41_EXODN|nr:uncharacterized protein HMPREF1120_02081 [Exophiala dermatitidis NIH/UT8656]EHY53901.1 hypothetical protein HMPREF1120_02081 [Exophiala dermatitidis NIH/UT8656]